MTIRELMTQDPACCTPETTIREVARMMIAHDCGEIPVVSDKDSRLLIGVVTDRDIVCRAVAEGLDPERTTIDCCMSSPVATVGPGTSLEECLNLMEDRQIRRVPVVDERGACRGIVSQADIAMRAPTSKTAELVREVSKH
jgi:CBS domain-containing protein